MARLDGLEKRIGTLEARQPPVKSETQKFLEKCTVEELNRILELTEKGGDNLDKLPSEDKAFIEDLEARYGHC